MKKEFINGEHYHIFNRGVEKREIFLCEEDYCRFLLGMREFNCQEPIGSLYGKIFRDKFQIKDASIDIRCPVGHRMSDRTLKGDSRLVKIIAYCLNPNHYHLILEQVKNSGISKFMQKIGNGYTKYFNAKYERSGFLFQGKFKSVFIESNEQLLYLSAYVNRNHFIHKYSEGDNWNFSSLDCYLGRETNELCEPEIILSQFNNNFSDYGKFCSDMSLYSKEKKEFVKKCLE